MNEKEKAQIELKLKNLLYFIEDENEQKYVIKLLNDCEGKMKDPKLKNRIDKIILVSKKTYIKQVEFLIHDILSSKISEKEEQAIKQLLIDLKPSIEKGEKSFWDKLKDLIGWS